VRVLADGGWSLRLLFAQIERSFFDEFSPVRSLVLSVPGEGFYSISGEREGRIGLLDGRDDRLGLGFLVNASCRFVSRAFFTCMQSRTPLATATESLAFRQSAELSPSGVGEASLCLDGSDIRETTGELAIGFRKVPG
jgi:hypothetical protein